MGTQYINCPKCGTRNFLDDKECGVCNATLGTQLPTYENSRPQQLTSKKSNYLIVILLFVGVLYLLFLQVTEKKSETPIDNSFVHSSISTPNYTFKKVEVNIKKFRLEINIENKLTDSQLISIARKIYLDINTTANSGAFFFYLPVTNKFKDAWARVDFPEMQVSYLGQSLKQEQLINVSLDKITDYVGIWTSNMMRDGLVIRIRKDKSEGYVFEYITPDNLEPSRFPSPLKRVIRNGKVVFIEKDSPSSQYYVIEENGDLSDYDKDGLYETYKKLK
jgi:hypothetical protein